MDSLFYFYREPEPLGINSASQYLCPVQRPRLLQQQEPKRQNILNLSLYLPLQFEQDVLEQVV